MGVVAASGADTPRYRPEMPSVTNVFRSIPNTDALPTPPVCIRTLTRSNGWPTSTAHTPPTPPDRKLLRADSGFGSDVCISSFVMVVVIHNRFFVVVVEEGFKNTVHSLFLK